MVGPCTELELAREKSRDETRIRPTRIHTTMAVVRHPQTPAIVY
jgi:hypothetical protein